MQKHYVAKSGEVESPRYSCKEAAEAFARQFATDRFDICGETVQFQVEERLGPYDPDFPVVAF